MTSSCKRLIAKTVSPGLTVLHHVWLREHNSIAEQLGVINPHWTGERIFQETRRIIAVHIQHITYNEFLVEVLDPATVSYKKERGYWAIFCVDWF